MKREIIETGDGSKTIRFPDINENYHSTYGALQEAKYVFIKYGWDELKAPSCSILEVGFGTGLNTIITLINGEKDNRNVHYTGLEAYPVSDEEVKALNYVGIEELSTFQEEYSLLHSAPWGEETKINDRFTLLKIEQKMEDFFPKEGIYDMIYFDAFGPRVQPEMWERKVLQKMYDSLAPGGKFVTYCAKGDVRRDLVSIGFELERIPGPPGKREMLRGTRK